MFEEALPGALVFAESLLQILENSLEVGVGAQVVPRRILLEPGIVLVAEIDGAAQPVQRFAGVAFDGEVGGEAVGHLAVGFGGGQGVVLEESGGAGAIAGLHVTQRQRGHGDAQRLVVANHAFQNLDGRAEIAHAHLLIAGGSAQQRVARLEGEAFVEFVAGQLELVLIVVDAGAVVVEDGGVGRD